MIRYVKASIFEGMFEGHMGGHLPFKKSFQGKNVSENFLNAVKAGFASPHLTFYFVNA